MICVQVCATKVHMVCICDACAGMVKHIVFHEVLRNTRECLWDIYHRHDMHNTPETRYNTQNEKQTWRACIIGIILPKPIKPKHQTQQNIHRPYSTSYFKIQTKTQNPRNQGQEIWNTLRKRENPYLFLKIGEEMMVKKGVLWMRTVSLEKGGMDKTMNSHNMRGKNENLLKISLKITLNEQNTRFSQLEWVANKSPSQVAKTRVTNFEKFV